MLNQADKTSFDGDATENLISQFGLHQMFQEPTHISDTSSSLYVDLIFTSQPNLIIQLGAQSPLRSNCHHQIIYAKFNLRNCIPYSLLFEGGLAL